MLKPSLQLTLGQQLTMTPQLQQAIRLLQLPALELQAHIRELLETNVMLEPLEEPEGTGTFETILTAAEQPKAAERAAESSVEVLEEGWGEHSVGPADRPWNGDDDERQQEYADSSGESLQDHLLWQLERRQLQETNGLLQLRGHGQLLTQLQLQRRFEHGGLWGGGGGRSRFVL